MSEIKLKTKPTKKTIDEVPEAERALDAAIEATQAMSRYHRGMKAEAAHHGSCDMIKYSGFNPNTKFHNIIGECTDVYYTTPIVRNIIDLMTDFATEGLRIEHRVDAQQRFYNEWARRSKFLQIIPEVFHTVLLTGNCFVVRNTGRLSRQTQREMSKAALESPRASRSNMPISYTILNPRRINIDQSELFSQRVIKFQLDERDRKNIAAPSNDMQRAFVKSLPPSMRAEIQRSGFIEVEPDRIIPLHYKKLPWESWSVPLIFSAIDDINFKKMLRQMDEKGP